MRQFILPILFFVALTISGCDSSEVHPPTFAVEVDGAVSATFEGEPEADRFDLNLPLGQLTNYDFYFRGEEFTAEFSISTLNGPLQRGTYPIVRWGERPPEEATASLFAGVGTDDFRAFRSIAGTVEITNASGNRVGGIFEFTARDRDAIPPDTVRVSGEFSSEVRERE